MPALTTVFGLAALASTFVRAAPIEIRAAPKHWATGYLEDYDAYHLRYLAIGCQNKHNTTFFEDCCHPLLSTQTLAADRPAYCAPNATQIASASSYIASTSLYGPPTTTASVTDAAATTCITDDATVTPTDTPKAAPPTTSPSATTTDTPKAAYAEPTTTTTKAAPTTTTPAYVAPTTTTQAYVAPTTTKAAATTTQASSGGGSGTQTGGFATYFYQGGNAGACGNYHSDSDYIIAIDSAWWPNFGATSQYCGRWITVQNTNNGKTVTAQVADVCPSCVNGNSLDLSVGAFTAIASTGDGMVPINWWWA